MTTDYPDWGTSQDHADKIFSTGTPAASKSILVYQLAQVGFLAGAQKQSPPISIDQTGYEIGLSIQCSASPLVPFLIADLLWTDSVTGLVIGHDVWSLPASSAANGQTYYGSGPTKGDTLVVTLINADASGVLPAVSASVAQNSRAYVRDDWRQQSRGAVPGFSAGNGNQAGNLLIVASPNVPTTLPATRIIPFYAGRIRFMAQSTVPFTLEITSLDTQVGTGFNDIFIQSAALVGTIASITGTTTLTRSGCVVSLTNNGAATAAIYFSAVIDELAA